VIWLLVQWSNAVAQYQDDYCNSPHHQSKLMWPTPGILTTLSVIIHGSAAGNAIRFSSFMTVGALQTPARKTDLSAQLSDPGIQKCRVDHDTNRPECCVGACGKFHDRIDA
jgi:hypothetical protein